MGKDEKELEGGFDSTPLVPTAGKTYVVRITFIAAHHLPPGDQASGSADAFVLAQVNSSVATRHKHDPHIRFRTPTAHRTLEPRWNTAWVLAGVPASGFELKARVYDEDTGTQDDRLGTAYITTGPLKEGWSLGGNRVTAVGAVGAGDGGGGHRNSLHGDSLRGDQGGADGQLAGELVELQKRGASWRALAAKSCCGAFSKHARGDATLRIAIEVLGPTEDECGKLYTVNSCWYIHYSPLIGRMVGTTTRRDGDETANFQANEMQLVGPVPNELYHRFVDFSFFVNRMFQPKGARGHVLHAALHRQHCQIYHFDEATEYGTLPGPGRDMARRFLDMAHWGEGDRIFTYIINLDGLMRFTETGKEFAIDLLSKHTMHSDVNVYIAISGEFFVRKYEPGQQSDGGGGSANGEIDTAAPSHSLLRERNDGGQDQAHVDESRDSQATAAEATAASSAHVAPDTSVPIGTDVNVGGKGEASSNSNSKSKPARRTPIQPARPKLVTALHGAEDDRPLEPEAYELVIDNDSGTYRPNKKVLPLFERFLAAQFPGLHIKTMSSDDDHLQAMKKERRKRKAERNQGRVYAASAGDLSSIESSRASSPDGSDDGDDGGRNYLRGTREKGLDFMTDPKGAVGDKWHGSKVHGAIHSDHHHGNHGNHGTHADAGAGGSELEPVNEKAEN